MKNTKTTVDTNILVYAHNADSPFFPSARELIEQLIEQGGFTVTSLILFEFYAVITDGRKIEKPLAPKDALAIIRDLVDSQRIGVLESFNAKKIGEWLRTYGDSITRYQIYDANIAFSMQQEGLSKIYTLNTKDFKKFDFIDPVNPFEPSPLSSSLQAPRFIPYGRQSIDEKDVAAVCSVLRSDWLTTGPKVAEFEQAVADYVGAKYAVAVSSGTAALHAAMYAIGIKLGDKVIIPPITFAATANCVVYQGGTPVFADVDPDTLLLDPAKVEEKITEKTKAIIGVDYAGQPCDWDRLREIADRHKLRLVADGCHALGAEYKGRKVGSLADMTVFSFHPVKHITTGEGGMITTDNAELTERMRLFRNHGITRDPKCFSPLTSDLRPPTSDFSWFYEIVDLGYNYRMTDFQCALGISQLQKLPKFLKRRREIAARYDEAFSGLSGINPLAVRPDVLHAYHIYVIRVDSGALGIDRTTLFTSLREKGIAINVHYIPVHFHPFYMEKFHACPGLCPVAEAAYEQIISLPMFPGMTDENVEKVVTILTEMAGQKTQ
jgi:perosamine synthetase